MHDSAGLKARFEHSAFPMLAFPKNATKANIESLQIHTTVSWKRAKNDSKMKSRIMAENVNYL